MLSMSGGNNTPSSKIQGSKQSGISFTHTNTTVMQQYLTSTTTHQQQAAMNKTFSRFKYNRGSMQEKVQSPLNPKSPGSRPIVVQKDMHIKAAANKQSTISPDTAHRGNTSEKFSNLMSGGASSSGTGFLQQQNQVLSKILNNPATM